MKRLMMMFPVLMTLTTGTAAAGWQCDYYGEYPPASVEVCAVDGRAEEFTCHDYTDPETGSSTMWFTSDTSVMYDADGLPLATAEGDNLAYCKDHVHGAATGGAYVATNQADLDWLILHREDIESLIVGAGLMGTTETQVTETESETARVKAELAALRAEVRALRAERDPVKPVSGLVGYLRGILSL